MKDERIAKDLLVARFKEKGLTQAELSQKIGMDVSTFYTKVTGRSYFRQDEISDIARVLSLTDNDILVIFFPSSWAAQQYQKTNRKPA